MYFFVKVNTSKTLFFHMLLLNGINLIQTFVALIIFYFFHNAFLKFIRPVERKIFNIDDPFGIKMLTRLRLGFRHLREHKFGHGFKDTLNPLYYCTIEAATIARYFLHCYFYNSSQDNLMNDLENMPISSLWLVITI